MAHEKKRFWKKSTVLLACAVLIYSLPRTAFMEEAVEESVIDFEAETLALRQEIDLLKQYVQTLEGILEVSLSDSIIYLEPIQTVDGSLYDVENKIEFGSQHSYSHSFFQVTPGKSYWITGASSSSTRLYPMAAFYDKDGNLISTFGTDKSRVYREEYTVAPEGAALMVVNRNNGLSDIKVKCVEVFVEQVHPGGSLNTRAYNLDTADALIREAKRNPFCFSAFDQGYVTFVFDDLAADLDSVASIFEEYGYPLVVAAIPEFMNYTAKALTEPRGSFTPGMRMKEIMALVVANGGEIMTHNASPVVNEENQYDYDFMYKYFVTSKKTLEAAGFHPRGLIRAGGKNALERSEEIDRWLIGNYEYSDMGTLPQYACKRVSIQQPNDQLKERMLSAKENKTWLSFMCHSYVYGNGETFTGEDDLRDLLSFCKENGIAVVTCSYMFDHFSSTVLTEQMRQLTSGQ